MIEETEKSNNIETGIINVTITTTYLIQNAFNLGIDSEWARTLLKEMSLKHIFR